MKTIKRNCIQCGKSFNADMRNVKRGWGKCCSKSCAAKKRERSRPDYNPIVVAENNLKRMGFSTYNIHPVHGDYDEGDSEYWDSKDFD